MMVLQGRHIALRALEQKIFSSCFRPRIMFDLGDETHRFLFLSILKRYLENAHQDIYESKQLRLMIVERECQQPVGMIDIFDFNPQHQRAGIGIVIEETIRGKAMHLRFYKSLLIIVFSFEFVNYTLILWIIFRVSPYLKSWFFIRWRKKD